ncbi:hypothetical protein BGW38_002185 [Lunasporangiospora selenospora]|uniref:MABP domain-containing protein n=1 Tax=Lunasporangiospora selenospora TaxID=979761 RepID=A0A9P6FTL2_9FUNG|nr:hypothetical protein BGW38_002185 [Lunasporangiospora selenospora]
MDIRLTTCQDNSCTIPGYRKIPRDLNRLTRGRFVHLHFTDRSLDLGPDDLDLDSDLWSTLRPKKRRPNAITDIMVLEGHANDLSVDEGWEQVDGNLNDGTFGPALTMYVRRDPSKAPIVSLVVKYGFDSHAAIGYDRLSFNLNKGTGGQWVYLYYKREGPRDPITHIAAKACVLPLCNLDDSWTRVNRPIITGTLQRYLYLFYKSVPGEPPITSVSLRLDLPNSHSTARREFIDTGVRFNKRNLPLDNLAVELGLNPPPFNWHAVEFDQEPDQAVPNWNARIIYRTGTGRTLPKKPVLRFRQDGSFKIVQFADMHMATGPHMCFGVPSNMNCTGDINTSEMMDRMLDAENPDLVVFTGDNVDGLTSSDAYSTILKYSKQVVERGIPWTIVFGNHDEEGDLSKEEMIQSVQDLPYCLSTRGPLDISGTGNYVLQIRRPRSHHRHHNPHRRVMEDYQEDEMDLQKDDTGHFTLYFLDSGAYSFNLEYPGYDWIKEDQVQWFRETSRAITSRYHKKRIPNALVFFHIPLPEYLPGYTEGGDGGDDDDDDDDGDRDENGKKRVQEPEMVGEKTEGVSAPRYNSGMFRAMVESKDARASTVGHDHLNEYILKYGDRVDTWKRLDDPDLTMASKQTLFIGKKSNPVPIPPSEPSDSQQGGASRGGRRGRHSGPSRTRETVLEWVEDLARSAQYVFGGQV